MSLIEITGDIEAYEREVASSNNRGFPPLPKGSYAARIVPLKKDGDRVKVDDWGGNGPNGKKKVLRIAVQIVDESPTGAKRYFQIRVPLFNYFAPKPGEAPKPARLFKDFWDAVGLYEEVLRTGEIPDPSKFLGKTLTIVLSEAIEPDSEYRPLGSNEVSFVNKGADISRTPTQPAGQPAAPWLTLAGELIPNYPFVTEDAQMYIRTLGADGAAPPAGTPAAQPSWATAPGGAAPAASTPSWATQPTTSDSLQAAAAASGQGF